MDLKETPWVIWALPSRDVCSSTNSLPYTSEYHKPPGKLFTPNSHAPPPEFLESYICWHLPPDLVSVSNLALSTLPATCSHHLCNNHWPTAIIVMYDQRWGGLGFNRPTLGNLHRCTLPLPYPSTFLEGGGSILHLGPFHPPLFWLHLRVGLIYAGSPHFTGSMNVNARRGGRQEEAGSSMTHGAASPGLQQPEAFSINGPH